MIDTSFLTGPAPVALLTPYEKQLRQNALAQQAMQLQGQQQAFSDQQAARSGMASYYHSLNAPAGAGPVNALAPPPTAAPAAPPSMTVMGAPGGASSAGTPDAMPPPAAAPAPAAPAHAAPVQRPSTPTIADLVNKFNVPPEAAAATVAAFQKVDAGAADIEKTHAEAAKAQGELGGLVQEQGALAANAIIKSGYNPAVIQHQLEHFASLPGPQYAQMAQQVAQHIQANPDQMPAIFQSMAAAGKGNREAGAAEQTAQSRATEVGNLTRTTDAKLATEQRGQALSAIGASKDQASWTAAFADLPMELKAKLGPVFSPARAAYAQQLGLSSQEQVTTAEASKRDAQTAGYQNSELGLSRSRLGLEQQRMDNEKTQASGAASDPNYIAGVVRGEIQLNPRDKNFAATSALAKGLDPSWTSDRFANAQHLRQSLASGPMNKKMESFNQLTSHLGELRTASDALGHNVMQYTPGMIANLSPTVKRYLDSKSTAGAELATTLAQGQATQHEVGTATENLNSGNPVARSEGIKQYTKLIGGRLRAVAKAYGAATGDAFPVDQYVDSDAIRELTRNGVNPYDIADQEKPAWMKAKGQAVGGVAPAAAAAPAHGVPDLGSTFNGGKVLKVTRID